MPAYVIDAINRIFGTSFHAGPCCVCQPCLDHWSAQRECWVCRPTD